MSPWPFILLAAALATGAVAGIGIASAWGSSVADLEQAIAGPRVAP